MLCTFFSLSSNLSPFQADMVGTRGKGSKSKSQGRALLSDKPEPLKIILAEAADGPYDEEEQAEILNSDVLPAFGGRHEKHIMDAMNDEEENTGFEINSILDENKAVLTNLDTKGQLEDVNDGVDATTNMDVENSDKKKNRDRPEENMSNRGDAVFNVHVENINKRTNGEEPEVDEVAPIGVEEKGPDVSACVIDVNKGLAASVKVPVENLADNIDYDKGSNELTAEELVSTPAENGNESIKETASPASGGKTVAVKVTQPKKKIIRKKLIGKKILPGKGVTAVNEANLQPSDGNEGSDVLRKVGTSNEVELQCQENNEAAGEACKLDNSENVTNEEMEGKPIVKVEENGSPANEVTAVAENVTQPKKKIIRKKLIRKKILTVKGVTAVNEAKLQPLDGIKGSVVSGKAGTSNENNEASGEVTKLDGTENVPKEAVEGEPVAKVNNKRIRIRRKKLQRQSDVQTGGVEPKPESTNDEPAGEENQTTEQEIKNKEVADSKTMLRLLKKRKNKMVAEEDTHNLNAKDIGEPGSSEKGKSPKKFDSMGMIFMCNSETKKDCYKYNVFGLPAAKKDTVSKIYKGMRLFLFDTNLKMMYGIYKAAAPGSYDVEPRAFDSQYPSQVRFTVLDDCLPISEEKFKKVIKENYFTKNKFDSHLTNEQVKNLCKLFRETTKKSKSKRGQIQGAIPPTRVDKKRKWAEDSRRVGPGPISSREREMRRKGPEQVRHTNVIRNHDHLRHAPVIRGHHETGHALVVRGLAETRPALVRNHDDLRHALVIGGHHETGHALVVRGQEEARPTPVGIDNRYRHPAVYERESYLPNVESSSLYQPLRAVEDPPRARVYSYERDPGVNTTYRRDPAVEYLDLGVSAHRESRQYADHSLPDPYATYWEPQRAQVYREPVYETDTRREHYDYLSTGVRYSEYYRPDDRRAPLPLHRRY